MNATYTVTEDDFTADWTAKVHFCGCVQVWFKDQYDWNGDGGMHWEYFPWAPIIYGDKKGFTCSYPESWGYDMENHPPVHYTDDDGNLVEDANGYTCSDTCCVFDASGKYTGIGGAVSHVTTDSIPKMELNDEFDLKKEIESNFKNALI